MFQHLIWGVYFCCFLFLLTSAYGNLFPPLDLELFIVRTCLI